MKQYVHLHLHTDGSNLDGMIKTSNLAEKCAKYNMEACAITDHGNMRRAYNFYVDMKKHNVKPIIGCEVYVSPFERYRKEKIEGYDYAYHMILLAKNNQGYKNLVKLSSLAYEEGFYYVPRVDHELLEKYGDNLIATSACFKGKIAKLISNGLYEKALKLALYYQEIFDNNFYLEIQDLPDLEDQVKLNKEILKLSKDAKIPVIITSDCHYLDANDSEAHRILLSIGTGGNLQFTTEETYVKSPETMWERWGHMPEVLTNTIKIANQIDITLTLGIPKIPKIENDKEEFKRAVYAGFKKKFPKPSKKYIDRLEYELKQIDLMDFESYFLIIKDIIQTAKNKGIETGAGRGSSAGSLVTYCLDITKVDPLEYGLYFERFLNPGRVPVPLYDFEK